MRLVHWLVTLPVTIVLIDFAVANRQEVPVALWPFAELTLPLWAVVLPALALGLICGVVIAWIGGRRWRREARACGRRVAALESELRAVEARLAEQDAAHAADDIGTPRRLALVGGRR